ncbi:3-deoxy-D-manno-octulosonic acid transferase [Congregicoccus parvus]|uniref:3-deoxy-D-manno-octulosonic acid transferase n=1 Tax=Congregicoccus parvus TaxID=3081749 RepID=UPI003FA5C6F3
MIRRGGLWKNLTQRFGCGPVLGPPPEGAKRIWIHAVSVGEVLAVGPLLEALSRQSAIELHLTTTTTTGYAVGLQRYAKLGVGMGYFPLDFWPFSVRAWKRIRPDLMVLTESELWPEHLRQARIRGVPVVLVNARISDRSLRRLRKIRWLVRALIPPFRAITAASEIDAARLREIGLPSESIEAVGNLKLDVAVAPPVDACATASLREELGVPDGLLLMGSSTWPGEEVALVRALRRIRTDGVNCRLLIVPRHAERRQEIREVLGAAGVRFHMRTAGTAPESVDVCVADTTGEMVRLLPLADLVFVGRSLPPNEGGQTPVESAALGRPILFGPRMTNFRAIAEGLVATGAARLVEDADDLAEAASSLMRNAETRDRMALAGLSWHRANKGALDRVVRILMREMGRP